MRAAGLSGRGSSRLPQGAELQGAGDRVVQLGYLLWEDGKREGCGRLCSRKQRCFGQSVENFFRSWWFVHVSNVSLSCIRLYAADFSGVVICRTTSSEIWNHMLSGSWSFFTLTFHVGVFSFNSCDGYSVPSQAASSAQIASAIFTVGNAFVLPFYSVMVLAPKWKWVRPPCLEYSSSHLIVFWGSRWDLSKFITALLFCFFNPKP